MRKKAKKKLRYFYLSDQLHKVISISHPNDLCVSWNYPESKIVGYVWSDLRTRYGKAFTLTEAASMVGRDRVRVETYILGGHIKAPQRTYTLDDRRIPGKYFFSEADVYDLHDYLLTVHIGRPRKDGRITPGKLPSKAELRAMMRHDVKMYTKSSSGEFIPVWKEVDW